MNKGYSVKENKPNMLLSDTGFKVKTSWILVEHVNLYTDGKKLMWGINQISCKSLTSWWIELQNRGWKSQKMISKEQNIEKV